MGVLALELLDESAGLEVTAELLKWRSAPREDEAEGPGIPFCRQGASSCMEEHRQRFFVPGQADTRVGDERSALMSFRQVRKLVLLHRRRKKVRS